MRNNDWYTPGWKLLKVISAQRQQLNNSYTRRFATTIFNATQRCNIVATFFRMITTLQHCVALKIVVANRPL